MLNTSTRPRPVYIFVTRPAAVHLRPSELLRQTPRLRSPSTEITQSAAAR